MVYMLMRHHPVNDQMNSRMYEVQRDNEDASASLALVCMAFLSVSSYLVLLCFIDWFTC
jgi:hypothetical protein